MIAISPWSRGGWVNSQVFDHTSVIRLLETRFGVEESNISAWRRQTFGDLTSAFRFDDGAAMQPTLPDTSGILEAAIYSSTHLPKPTLPGLNQTVPTQEQGERKRVPLANNRLWFDRTSSP